MKVRALTAFGQTNDADQPTFFELQLDGWDNVDWTPGQFVMIRPASWGFEPLWGRPFSISRVDSSTLTLFIQSVGSGTKRIAQLQPGESVTVWGPLGNGFPMPEDKPVLMLAGGIGVAPFIGYANAHPKPGTCSLLFGHRMPANCYPLDKFPEMTRVMARHEQTPDDLTAFLAEIRSAMAANTNKNGITIACGPTPFLKYIQATGLELKAKAYVSLENTMACGVGACLGCVCTDAKGHRTQTCTSGPVFSITQVNLLAS